MMDTSSIDAVMSVASAIGQVILLLILLRRRLYREFPVFTGYVAFTLLTPAFVFVTLHLMHANTANLSGNPAYFRVYLAVDAAETLLEFGVLIEIARNVFQPHRRSLPRSSLVIFGGLLVAGCIVTYILGGHGAPGVMLNRMGNFFDKAERYWAILRIVCFLITVAFAQLLSINWKNHVLQLATGLAFYGAVDLIVELAKARLSGGPSNVAAYHAQFRLLDQFRLVGYLSTLIYWSWSFARKEAKRKEFNPQMAGFLVSIAGAAKRSRSQLGR